MAPGTIIPTANSLPGEAVPYLMSAGEGARYELNGQLVTLIARPQDTGGQFGAYYVSGPRGAEMPFMAHRGEHQTVIVFDGLVQIWLGGASSILAAGDEVVIPQGVPFAYRMLSNYTRILRWSTPGTSLALYPLLGMAVDAHVHPVHAERIVTLDEFREVGGEFGITFPDLPKDEGALVHAARVPTGSEPYVLSAGEGEHLVGFEQMHTYLSRGANTGGQYFAVHSSGAKQGYVPLHFHQQHTENFFCFEGRVWLYVNGREMLLTKGDFVHAPPGTIHSYAFDSHHTQMIGFLSPDIFEPFFDYLFTPTDDTVYTEGGQPYFNEVGFQRVRDDLDLVVVGPPPERAKALDL
jgi:quercetin 2,3-dioxygenase